VVLAVIYGRTFTPCAEPDAESTKLHDFRKINNCRKVPFQDTFKTMIFCIVFYAVCGAGAERRGAEIKLLPGAGAEIMNCGSTPAPDLSIYQRLEEIYFF
jgi:hypothetical protein